MELVRLRGWAAFLRKMRWRKALETTKVVAGHWTAVTGSLVSEAAWDGAKRS